MFTPIIKFVTVSLKVDKGLSLAQSSVITAAVLPGMIWVESELRKNLGKWEGHIDTLPHWQAGRKGVYNG